MKPRSRIQQLVHNPEAIENLRALLGEQDQQINEQNPPANEIKEVTGDFVDDDKGQSDEEQSISSLEDFYDLDEDYLKEYTHFVETGVSTVLQLFLHQFFN